MILTVRVSKAFPATPWLAVAGVGFIGSLAVRLSSDLFAGGPIPLVVAAALALPAAAFSLANSRDNLRLAALSAAAVLSYDVGARGVVWLAGYPGLPPIACLSGLLLFVGLGTPLRAAAARAGRAHWSAAALCFVAGAWLDRGTLLVLVLGICALVAAFGWRAATESSFTAPVAWRSRAGRALVALPFAVLLFGGWAIARAALDPTPLGFVALIAGLGLGSSLSPGRWGIVPGLALAAGVVGAAVTRLPELLGLDPRAGTLAFLALGLGMGPLFGALRLDRVSASAVLGGVALLLSGLLPMLPPDSAARAARADAATEASLERLAALRAPMRLAWAGVGPTGASALYQRGNRVIVELDGGFADPDTRAGTAERFAGTLAACASPNRTRARVGGDDLGLAVAALRAQGYLAIDTAVPDAALVRAQADLLPDLAQGWLHPSVRLVPLPSPAVVRAGPEADAVVEIVRSPFTGGRAVFPNAGTLRAVRAGLAPGGVHVVSVATTLLGVPALRALAHDFVAVYPGASMWLPPDGADTALLLGTASGGALPWAGFERCVASDRAALDTASLRSALDVGALALADAASLAGLPSGNAVGPGLSATLREPPSLPLATLGTLTADPAVLFSGAPVDDLVARAPSRTLLLDLLQEATRGDIRDAFTRARALAEAPGGARALEPVVRPHLVRARQAIARGNKEGVTSKAWEEAEAAIGTARALAPRYAATRCLEAELAGERGQLARAEEAFAACVELDPTSLEGLDGLARARNSRGDVVGTEAALRAALRARPDAWTTSQNLGFFLLQLGRYEEAERLLKQASATQSRAGADAVQPAPYLALASLYLATDRAELALAQAQRASTLGPNPDALALRGAARFELRQLEQAESDYQAALQLAPTHVLARGGLGRVQATRGEYELAAASFRAVLAVSPDNAAARENMRLLGPHLREIQDR